MPGSIGGEDPQVSGQVDVRARDLQFLADSFPLLSDRFGRDVSDLGNILGGQAVSD